MTDTEQALREALRGLLDAAQDCRRYSTAEDRAECWEDAVQHANAALARAAAPVEPPSVKVEKYLRTLTWGDDEAGQTVGRAVQTHLRYFARWFGFPVEAAPAPDACPEGPWTIMGEGAWVSVVHAHGRSLVLHGTREAIAVRDALNRVARAAGKET